MSTHCAHPSVKWAQERALEEERRAQQTQIQNIHMETKMMLMEAQEEITWMASQATMRNREDAKKVEELQAGLVAYYAGTYAVARQEEKEVANTPANWWEKTKSFVQEKIVQPLNTYVYQPYVKPAVEKIKDLVTNGTSWINENVYQPYVQPALERNKQFVINESAWINEKIYQPYVQPALERNKQFVISESAWLNENVYQPYVQPALERNKQFVISESAWINEKIYQPYIQPVVERTKQFVISESAWINEKIYQPYLKPILDKTIEEFTDYASWINKNIYQPYIEPVVSDINQYVYQPYLAPLVDEASNWWEKYGEWVHGALDAAGFIPGLGEIADGLNGLIYLGEGRYLEATLSALAMIPVLGDLGKAGKLSLEIGKEAAEKVAKEIGEKVIEKEWMHVALEAASGIPGTGKVTDGLNSLIYLNKGRYLEAGISALSMIPVVGDLAKVGLMIGKEILGKAGEKLVKEVAEEVVEKTLKETGEELIEKIVKESLEETVEKTVKATVVVEMVEETLEQVNEETIQRVLKDVVEGKVTKLPIDIAGELTDESANELAEKISKELGGKKVWVSAKTNSIYVSNPPAEGFLLAEQLSKIDLTKTDEVEKILRRVAELTSRGSGTHVVLGPFGANGNFIQEALDTDGVFWDVGDELWKALENTGLDMFKANDQFLQLQIAREVDRFDIIVSDIDEVLNNINSTAPKKWDEISYTEKEILDLETMPFFSYERVGNSWFRIDEPK